MNGKITMDGYYRGNGEYELHTHGEKPNPKALCSLTYSIHHNYEVLDLLKMMQKSIQSYIDADCQSCDINSINRALQEAGLEPLASDVIKVILEEVAYQRASEGTEE